MIDFETLADSMKLPKAEAPKPSSPPWDEDAPFVTDESSTVVKKLPPIQDAATFIAEPLKEPNSLVVGLIHQGTKVILGGGSKSFKTWVQLDLAFCIAYGLPWLGFETIPGRVLFVNFEIHPVFFQKRLAEIASHRGVTMQPERFDVWNLRGHSAPYAIIIPQIINHIKETGYALVVLDPIYKLYGSANENDAGEVGMLLNSLERVCVETGAAVMFGAHYSKGNQSAKESIDRISGSGVFARDPDSIIPFTRHEEEGSFVIEPTLRNLPPVDPFVVTWNYPFMERDDSLDPNKLKQPTGRPKEFADSDILQMVPMEGIQDSEWQSQAAELGISRASFFRLKANLKHSGRIYKAQSGRWYRRS